MTRINAGYPPQKLSNKMLLAEHREIKRVPNMVASGRAKLNNLPQQFKLGIGHVRFFYDKCGYLLIRYLQVYKECRARGFNVTCYKTAWNKVPTELMNNWQPTQQAKQLIVQRIKQRSK